MDKILPEGIPSPLQWYNDFFGSISALIAWLQNWFVNEMGSNDFLVGILVPAVLTGALYVFRNFIGSILTYMRLMVTSEVSLNSDNEYYHDISAYLYKRSVSKIFQRFFNLSYNWHNQELELTIGYGRSFGFIGPWPVIINRATEDSTSARFKEKITITIIGGRRSAIGRLIEDSKKIIAEHKEEDAVRVYAPDSDGYNNLIAQKPKRSLDTVIIPDEQKEYIIDKIDKFISSEEEYLRKGLPYHLGVIIDGDPGTGKTSLIHAIASHYGWNISYQSGHSIKFSGLDLKKTVVVIEDIDATGMSVAKRKKSKKKPKKDEPVPIGETSNDGVSTKEAAMMELMSGASMSTVLNTLDGMLSPHGLITFATTNHYDSLDDAIVRPGRFDVRITLKLMQWAEWEKMCALLERENPVTEEQFNQLQPTQARYMLLYYTDDEIVEWFMKENNDG